MTTRRQFLRLMLAAGTMGAVAQHCTADAASASSHQAYLPLVLQPADAHSGPWPNDEGWIVAGPSGRFDQAIAWFHARSTIYTHYDLLQIVGAYERIGNEAGVDWFLALAQCAHETGSLTSWWCDRPRRNPAGIAVTGAVRDGTPDNPPGVNWAWDGSQWREGASFEAWDSFSVRAHLGRLLAYALPDWAATSYQRELIDYALAVRPLAAQIRGIAPTIIGLNGIWAVPGTEYGQRILDLAHRMRQS